MYKKSQNHFFNWGSDCISSKSTKVATSLDANFVYKTELSKTSLCVQMELQVIIVLSDSVMHSVMAGVVVPGILSRSCSQSCALVGRCLDLGEDAGLRSGRGDGQNAQQMFLLQSVPPRTTRAGCHQDLHVAAQNDFRGLHHRGKRGEFITRTPLTGHGLPCVCYGLLLGRPSGSIVGSTKQGYLRRPHLKVREAPGQC